MHSSGKNKMIQQKQNQEVDLNKYFDFNPFTEQATIINMIEKIGKGKEITLGFDIIGRFQVMFDNLAYFPLDQGKLTICDFGAFLSVPRDCTDVDWHENTAKILLLDIIRQMKEHVLKNKKANYNINVIH